MSPVLIIIALLVCIAAIVTVFFVLVDHREHKVEVCSWRLLEVLDGIEKNTKLDYNELKDRVSFRQSIVARACHLLNDKGFVLTSLTEKEAPESHTVFQINKRGELALMENRQKKLYDRYRQIPEI